MSTTYHRVHLDTQMLPPTCAECGMEAVDSGSGWLHKDSDLRVMRSILRADAAQAQAIEAQEDFVSTLQHVFGADRVLVMDVGDDHPRPAMEDAAAFEQEEPQPFVMADLEGDAAFGPFLGLDGVFVGWACEVLSEGLDDAADYATMTPAQLLAELLDLGTWRKMDWFNVQEPLSEPQGQTDEEAEALEMAGVCSTCGFKMALHVTSKWTLEAVPVSLSRCPMFVNDGGEPPGIQMEMSGG